MHEKHRSKDVMLNIWGCVLLRSVFGESLDELANRQRARIWLPLVGSHSGGIVS